MIGRGDTTNTYNIARVRTDRIFFRKSQPQWGFPTFAWLAPNFGDLPRGTLFSKYRAPFSETTPGMSWAATWNAYDLGFLLNSCILWDTAVASFTPLICRLITHPCRGGKGSEEITIADKIDLYPTLINHHDPRYADLCHGSPNTPLQIPLLFTPKADQSVLWPEFASITQIIRLIPF